MTSPEPSLKSLASLRYTLLVGTVVQGPRDGTGGTVYRKVSAMKTVAIIALVAGLFVFSGCATVTGTATGAFTGAVDAPVETYRHNRAAFHENPMLFGLDAVVMGPIGFATGPILGLAKGLSLDIQWIVGQVDYGDVFGSYGEASIWRPCTVQWPSNTETPLK